MTKNGTTTPEIRYTAADEIDRRTANKGLPKARKIAAPGSPEGARLSRLGGEELRAEAGTVKAPTVKAKPAPKAKPAKAKDPHTVLRQQAWDWRASEFKAGNKVTYPEACARFGTKPAKAV